MALVAAYFQGHYQSALLAGFACRVLAMFQALQAMRAKPFSAMNLNERRAYLKAAMPLRFYRE